MEIRRGSCFFSLSTFSNIWATVHHLWGRVCCDFLAYNNVLFHLLWGIRLIYDFGSGPLVRGMAGTKTLNTICRRRRKLRTIFLSTKFQSYDIWQTKNKKNNNNKKYYNTLSITTTILKQHNYNKPWHTHTNSGNREESKDERRWKNYYISSHPSIILSILVYISSFGQTKIKQNTHGRLFFVFLLLNRFS